MWRHGGFQAGARLPVIYPYGINPWKLYLRLHAQTLLAPRRVGRAIGCKEREGEHGPKAWKGRRSVLR